MFVFTNKALNGVFKLDKLSCCDVFLIASLAIHLNANARIISATEKMKNARTFLLICFFASPLHNYAGNSVPDSLVALLSSGREDSNKVNTMLLISKTYLASDPLLSIRYSKMAKELAEKIHFKKGIAVALKNIGLAYYGQSSYIETLNSWQESRKIFESIGDKVGVANMLNNEGAVYFNQGDDAKALDFYLRALKISEEVNDTVRIVTSLYNVGSVYANKFATHDKALMFYLRALPLCVKVKDNYSIGTITVNLGELYFLEGRDTIALEYFMQSLKAYEGTENIPYSLNSISKIFLKRKDFTAAIERNKEAYDISLKLDAKLDIAQSLVGLANAYYAKGETRQAIQTFLKAEIVGKEINANKELKETYEGLTSGYASLKDFSNAYKYQDLLINQKELLYNIETDKKLGTLLFNFEMEKKQGKINLLTKDKKLQEQAIKRQKLVRNSFIGGFAIVLLFAVVFLRQRNRITIEKKRSDELLLNILPEETAEELKLTGKAKTKSFDLVSVLFTDFKNFTQASELLSAEELVQEINFCYSEFDRIVSRHGIEKIKTIGDAYMCVGGLPVTNQTHPGDTIKAGLEMQEFIEKNKAERIKKGQPYFELRLGIHTGPVVAGIVGIKKFAYDIWGDTVNTASRMESSGEIGKVNISGATYEMVKDQFNCIHRGKIEAKNKGFVDMYFVDHRLAEG